MKCSSGISTPSRTPGEEGEIILALLQLLRRLAKDPSPKVGDWGRGGPESVRAEGGA